MDVTRLFRVLSDETRFRLLRLLAKEELTVNELAQATQLAQPRISNHLKILREEGLIDERREGSWRYYRVEPEKVPAAARVLWPSLEETWNRDSSYTPDDRRLESVLTARHVRTHASFFDELAGRWDTLRQNLFGEALGRAILRAFLPEGLVVADIGTGTGYVLQLFGDRARKLIAVDHSEAMLSLAREKARATNLGNVEFRLANAEDSPLAPAEADVITLIQVLHHLEDPGRVLIRLSEGLRPGGILILNDFLEHQELWLRKELQHHWLGFERSRIEGWLREAGLELLGWEVMPGNVVPLESGLRMRIPDGFTAVARLSNA